MSHKKKKPLPYFFHPREIAFAGLSGSGKTTLIEKLIQKLSPEHHIGYVKSDAHKFEMDREGKDTQRMFSSGATNFLINDANHFARVNSGSFANNLVYQNFVDDDFVFVEGYKNSELPKILVLDEACEILEFIEDTSKVIGLVGPWIEKPNNLPDLPYHHRDDVDGIQNFIFHFFAVKIEKTPLYGLVLGGGKSTRMGEDKNFLEVDGKSLTQRGIDLLEPLVEQVFFSGRPDQFDSNPFSCESIEDSFLGMGPLGGILSAQRKHPNAAWLVIACDLPAISNGVLKNLIDKRNPLRLATAYQSEYVKHPEPLCAIWEPLSYTRSLEIIPRGFACPRNVLRESRIELLEPFQSGALDNANTPEEFDRIKAEVL